MNIPTEIIHIEWSGPPTLKDVAERHEEHDYGVYQIHGAHNVYGLDVLLYIGKANAQHFGTRIPQEKEWLDNHDAERIRVYLGRIAGEITPDDDGWGRQIDLAERLLIYSHSPAFNAQRNLGGLSGDLQNVHVLNWGCHASLMPEVSGARWAGKFGLMPGYHEYSTNDPRGASALPPTS